MRVNGNGSSSEYNKSKKQKRQKVDENSKQHETKLKSFGCKIAKVGASHKLSNFVINSLF